MSPEIAWSREALDAFQKNSYVARVTFDDGFVAIVSCPPGAARLPQEEWKYFVLHAATEQHMAAR